ncbi:hypothetical protein K4A87_12750 [Xanthomonas fragariae]|uniref:hypothetical protein n=1 Tax=Xanthomonas fragariae TaxID=48664 RepID=UPI001ABEC30E|nr:hypothetical protein [Xanthomonas fragariae]UKR51664.1 hypothetical protein K4A87_12750 [Xanthomonas fragariae]
MDCDDLPPNSHLQLWPADAPELQGATAQQPAFENAAVHEEPRAAANRPSTLPGGPAPFAKLSGDIRDGTVLSGSNTPYEDDTALIARFVDGAQKGKSNFNTTRVYSHALIRFSDWLRQQNKGSVQERLFKDKEALEQDASNFQQGNKRNPLTAALNHLRTMAVATDGTVQARGYHRHDAPDEDTQFINAALSAKPQQASALRAFSAWLHDQGKKGLCETGRLHSQTLMDDAKAFVNTRIASSSRSMSALKQLRAFYRAGATDIVARSNIFPLTPEGGWPQAAEGVWIPDTPGQEVTGPAWPAQTAASSPPLEFDWGGALHQEDVLLQGHQNLSHLSQTHPSNWDLDNFSDQFMGHSLSAQPGASISSFAFDPDAVQPEATERHHSTAMPQASILTFDENDTGLDWNDSERRVPE